MQQELSFEEMVDDLWESAQTDSRYLGHPSALEGKKWSEIEHNKYILVDDNDSETPSVFWLVGQLNGKGFWLYPDGLWNKNLIGHKPFYAHHSTAFLTRPDASRRLSSLFNKAMDSTQRLENFKKNHNVHIEHKLIRLPPDLGGERCLKLKHRIFVPRVSELDDVESQTNDETQETLCDDKEEDSDNRGSGSNTQQEARTENSAPASRDVWQEIERQWPLKLLPCHSSDARQALRELLNNNEHGFKWQLMEAYDVKDDPMHPNEYRKLRGATVLCSISISRWEVKGGYTFSPHIVQLRVLLPPCPFGTKPETPKKRHGIDSGSPLKKRSRRE